MYRPPEMFDKYLKMDVDLKADIWMLGCILFTLCFGKQPFQDA
jgi:AP2-associated kinase